MSSELKDTDLSTRSDNGQGSAGDSTPARSMPSPSDEVLADDATIKEGYRPYLPQLAKFPASLHAFLEEASEKHPYAVGWADGM